MWLAGQIDLLSSLTLYGLVLLPNFDESRTSLYKLLNSSLMKSEEEAIRKQKQERKSQYKQ